MKTNTLRFIFAVILGGFLANFIHIHVGGAPIYSTFIQSMSYLTKWTEALGVAILYYLMGDRLPTQSRIIKGFLLGVMILLAEGQLVRQLFMNLLLPNTIREVFVIQSRVWLATFVMTFIITLLIKPKYDQFPG